MTEQVPEGSGTPPGDMPPPQWPYQPPAYPPANWQQPPPYGAPPSQPGGWPPAGGYGYPRPQETSGFAIASLVCSLAGVLLIVVGPLLGIIFGGIGLNQMSRLGQRGRGLAIAGITIGAILLFLDVVGLIAIATDATGDGSDGISV